MTLRDFELIRARNEDLEKEKRTSRFRFLNDNYLINLILLMAIPPWNHPRKPTYFISPHLPPTPTRPRRYSISLKSSLLASSDADRGLPATSQTWYTIMIPEAGL